MSPAASRPRLRLITASFAPRPSYDTAVSRAILQRVGEGAEPPTLRLYRPGRVLAFGPQDARSLGYAQAVEAARAGGFVPVQRLAGGRAAVFHEETIAFSWVVPDDEARAHVHARFAETASLVADAFAVLGVDARVGEVPGEYCPGDYSVNARGATKLMGVGQRIVAGAAHVGGVVVVDRSDLIRDILLPVYAALGLPWDPVTAGSVADEAPRVTYDAVFDAVLGQFATRFEIEEGGFTAESLELASSYEADYFVS